MPTAGFTGSLHPGCALEPHTASLGLASSVGVALDRQEALLVADDVGNVVWRVSTGR